MGLVERLERTGAAVGIASKVNNYCACSHLSRLQPTTELLASLGPLASCFLPRLLRFILQEKPQAPEQEGTRQLRTFDRKSQTPFRSTEFFLKESGGNARLFFSFFFSFFLFFLFLFGGGGRDFDVFFFLVVM